MLNIDLQSVVIGMFLMLVFVAIYYLGRQHGEEKLLKRKSKDMVREGMGR